MMQLPCDEIIWNTCARKSEVLFDARYCWFDLFSGFDSKDVTRNCGYNGRSEVGCSKNEKWCPATNCQRSGLAQSQKIALATLCENSLASILTYDMFRYVTKAQTLYWSQHNTGYSLSSKIKPAGPMTFAIRSGDVWWHFDVRFIIAR